MVELLLYALDLLSKLARARLGLVPRADGPTTEVFESLEELPEP